MAGVGPAPKDPSQRRNRHVPQRGEWVDLAPLEKRILPELPEITDRETGLDWWRSQTRMAWEAWACDPVTQMWSPADHAHAFDTILLHNGMGPSSANEIRLRMDGLGLTPKGKRDLRWRIGSADEGEASPRRTAGSQSRRRSRLSVVK